MVIAVNVRQQLVKLERWRQLGQAGERLQREIIIVPSLPVTLFELGPAFGWRRQLAFLLFFFRRPIRVIRLAVDFRQRSVNAVQVRRFLESLPIKEKRAAELSFLHARIRDQRQPIGRFRPLPGDRFECASSQRFVAIP